MMFLQIIAALWLMCAVVIVTTQFRILHLDEELRRKVFQDKVVGVLFLVLGTIATAISSPFLLGILLANVLHGTRLILNGKP